MSDQEAPTQRQLQIRKTLAPSDSNVHWRTLFRIDEFLSREQIARLQNAALEVPGVGDLRILDDQQLQPHTVVSLEYHSISSELQASFLADRFLSIANARLNHPAGTRRPVFQPVLR